MKNKVYTIGRDPSCDIVIVDNTDVVSRVHASLKVKGGGKFILVDQGRNGTYVNGIRMSQNEEIPVTRKDVISFAHIADLDWNQVPKEKSKGLLWGTIGLAVILILGIIGYFIFKPQPKVEEPQVNEETPLEALPDTNVKNDTIRDTVFIKEPPKEQPKKRDKKTKTEEPQPQQPEEKNEVIDALY